MGGDLQVSCQPHFHFGRGRGESRKSNKEDEVLLSPGSLADILLQLPSMAITALAEFLTSEISERN